MYKYKTSFWHEVPESKDPFVAQKMYCCGYDVAQEILQKASYVEYLFLLIAKQRPDFRQQHILEKLAIALANAGPKNEAVRAAMNGGAVECSAVTSLIAALGVNSGLLGGSREVFLLMEAFNKYELDLDSWKDYMNNPNKDHIEDVWTSVEHRLGMRPMTQATSTYVVDCLKMLGLVRTPGVDRHTLRWLYDNYQELETSDQHLSMSFVAAAAFRDLGLNTKQSEMLYLLLCLPGAAAHALDSNELGFSSIPFYGNAVKLDPAYDIKPQPLPDVSKFNI